MTYLLIFISSLLAATILPFSSEITVVSAVTNNYLAWLIWLAASLGNTLGAMINWGLGFYIEKCKHHRWFPFKPEEMESAQKTFNRYGVWILLFAWLPIIGDALTLIGGIMRVRLWLFVLLVAIGKSIRYAIVIYATLHFV